jgi:hypothetical protein
MKAYYIMNVWDKDVLDVEDASEFEHTYDIHAVKGGYDRYECEWLVEEISKHYYSDRDGWEIANTWSHHGIDVALWDENKNFIGTFSSTLEYEPTFYVRKKDE